ncbi:MAG: SSU rRNA (adenine(1518)-N(6)/adenine(1519)-N(6))-dimethyltransferase [Candidatus Carbobacillus altaicus]|uniref:Ribosomal RNA small subunit methyltransferase A n=1 Tax=Candidatus Carbonibacillus altaicus TaxID=2163959 RepID=A0A2R6XYJ1_9BACL|nr:MAG: SSU rRNA (adenine(1518)-N(6)/adenine(1519)-N(6))-dimethyltransferase [Candidatus Carbobacillus altaicus]
MKQRSHLLQMLHAKGIVLKKSLGQNFLSDPNILEDIVRCARVTAEDTVLEIGPGAGTLTSVLAEVAKGVWAVEIDARLIALLEERFQGRTEVRIIHGDILKLNLDELFTSMREQGAATSPIKIVANLPYYITTPILFYFFETYTHWQTMTIMVQKEVAERIVAEPGTKAYGHLTLARAAYARAEMCRHVPREAFFPIPKVDSIVLHLTRYPTSPFADHLSTYQKLIRLAFHSRRKTLANNLRQAYPHQRTDWGAWLERLGYPRDVRGETLRAEDFYRLAQAFDEEHD